MKTPTLFKFLNVPLILMGTTRKLASNKFVMEVPVDLTKIELRNILTQMYNVRVLKINTMNYEGKVHRRKGAYRHKFYRDNRYKKAIVTLEPADYLNAELVPGSARTSSSAAKPVESAEVVSAAPPS